MEKKKQSILSRFSSEVKYRALTIRYCEI